MGPSPFLSTLYGVSSSSVRTQPPLQDLPGAPSASSNLRRPPRRRPGANRPRRKHPQLHPPGSGGRAPVVGRGGPWTSAHTRTSASRRSRGMYPYRTQRESGPWCWRGRRARLLSTKRHRPVGRWAETATTSTRPSEFPHGRP